MQHFHSQPEPQTTYTSANTSPYNTATPIAALDAAEQRRLEESIEDYLDRVCRPLMDTLPYAARQELRREIAQHLNALVQAYRESGYAPALATEKALDKFGPPPLVAQKWNPVTANEGHYKRIERWFSGQWQGIALTLTLCGVAGLLGLMIQQSGALSSYRLMPHLQPAAATVTTPTILPRPLTYTAMAGEQDTLARFARQQNALDEARALREQACAELTEAQAHLAAHQVALQNAEVTLAYTGRYATTRDILHMGKAALELEISLAAQHVIKRSAAVAQAEATLEAIRSQLVQKRL